MMLILVYSNCSDDKVGNIFNVMTDSGCVVYHFVFLAIVSANLKFKFNSPVHTCYIYGKK